MGSNLPFFPEQASTFAPDVDHLMLFLLTVAIFFTVLIFGAILYFAIRYRRRSEQELPQAPRGGMLLEILWSVIPFGITMVIFVWGASVFYEESRPPDNAMPIYVVGKQWMWKVEHLEGQREINELHIPVGRAGEAHDDLGRRDPQLLRAGVSHEERRGAGTVLDHLVSADQGGQISLVLRRVLRHAPFGNDRVGVRDEAAGLPELAERRAGGNAGRGRREALPQMACRTATSRTVRDAARA